MRTRSCSPTIAARTPPRRRPRILPTGVRRYRRARTRLKISPDQLAALRAEEVTLASQLGRRPNAAGGTGRDDARMAEDQYRTRAIQLQTELDRLVGTYTDEHPDVKRVKRDLANAKAELKRAEEKRTEGDTARATASALDDSVTVATRARLEEVRRQIFGGDGSAPPAALGRRDPAGAVRGDDRGDAQRRPGHPALRAAPPLRGDARRVPGSPQATRERPRVDGDGRGTARPDPASSGSCGDTRDRERPPPAAPDPDRPALRVPHPDWICGRPSASIPGSGPALRWKS